MHRFVWDLHYPPLDGPGRRAYGMGALFRDTPAEPLGPWVCSGDYTVKLTIDGRNFTQPLTVTMDPRVKTPRADLELQHALSMRCYDGVLQARTTTQQIRSLRTRLAALGNGELKSIAAAADAMDRKAAALEGRPGPRGRRGPAPADDAPPTLARVSSELNAVMQLLQEADMTPTTQAVAAADRSVKALADLLKRWNELKDKDLKDLNDQLRKSNLPAIGP
jgi:hypothetical protein